MAGNSCNHEIYHAQDTMSKCIPNCHENMTNYNQKNLNINSIGLRNMNMHDDMTYTKMYPNIILFITCDTFKFLV
jgi:hypothetical protein